MKPLIGPLLRAMHRLAKEHNQAPAAGLLSAKADQPAGLVLNQFDVCRLLACMSGGQVALRTTASRSDCLASPSCRLRPTEAAHGSGSWFMWNALDGKDPLPSGGASSKKAVHITADCGLALPLHALQWQYLRLSPSLRITASTFCQPWSCSSLGSLFGLAPRTHLSCTSS